MNTSEKSRIEDEAADAGAELPEGGWKPRPALNVARGGLTGATLGATTYAAGGFTTDFGAELDSVEARDPASGRWQRVAPMPTARGNPCAAAARGRLYVLGGFVRGRTVGAVEAFEPGAGRWSAARPLPGPRGAAGAVALGDRIYVLGGFDAADLATSAVDVYDARSDAWRPARPMATPRGLLQAVVLGDRIYAVGGVDDDRTRLAVVEEYDPAADRWRTVAPMHSGRGNPGAVAAGGRVFAVGGAGEGAALKTTEAYDPAADRWDVLAPLFPVGRASLSAAAGQEPVAGRARIVAFGGFEGTADHPIATGRVEELVVQA